MTGNLSETRSFFAHSQEGTTGVEGWQDLAEHLENVANLAQGFAQAFGSGDWGRAAGLWHDLGKFRPPFQNRLLSQAGHPLLPVPPGSRPETEHAIVGAIHACQRMGGLGRVLAYPIAGHHGGLPDGSNPDAPLSSLEHRIEKKGLWEEALKVVPPNRILNPNFPQSKPPPGTHPAFWIRMLFSCLVDADYLDTERFMDGEKAGLRGGFPCLSELKDRFDRFMSLKIGQAPATMVNTIRKKVFESCLEGAEKSPGLFSLTVPTGGGKTLSSLAFALNHALRHEKRRIIYVIPYLSIIEQTAEVFRQVLGPVVIEHHSQVTFPENGRDDGERSRLAAENWDAPIVVTTAVQFFESLFANRPSRSRKVHRIAKSVVILDEAQMLPPDFLIPVLHALTQLHQHYHTSIVLCTATQPALDPINSQDFHFEGLPGRREIMEDPVSLHQELKRVRVHLPEDWSRCREWPEIASEILKFETVLTVVNTRRDALALVQMLPRGTVHLSAAMCGEHRRQVIERIKADLAQGLPVRVVSTQLVECGVDLDFPVVFRALAGLDSIAQAAGRCNREGLLAWGEVWVFIPPRPAPPGHLRQAEQACRSLLLDGPEDPLAPGMFDLFFQELYFSRGPGLDRHDIMNDLNPAGNLRINFRTAAEKFRFIGSADQVPVIVEWGDGKEIIDHLRVIGPTRDLLRRAQRYIVNVPKFLASTLLQAGGLERIGEEIWVQTYEDLYDEEIGFSGQGLLDLAPEDLII